MDNTTNTLSVAQLLILTTAAGRPDQMVMPLPATLRARGASQQRLLASLLKRSLVMEVPADASPLSCRHDETGQHYALKLTQSGREAVGGSVEAPHAEGNTATDVTEALPEATTTDTPTADVEDAPATGEPKTPGGKLGDVLTAVGRPDGATLDDLVTLTGWLPHTTRAALTRLKQRGYPVELVKQPHRKAYCLSQAAKI